MKKHLIKKLLLALGCALLGAALMLGILLITGDADFSAATDTSAGSLRSQAVCLALEAAQDVKNQDFEALGTLVSPQKGLVFTPYSTVNLATDRWFTAEEVKHLADDSTVYSWGTDPATGQVTEKTASDYFGTVLGDYDYTCSPVIGVNYITEKGNALENVTEVFPGATFVDLHNPGTDGRWTTLRLVFEEEDSTLYLVAVIHCQYTI